MSRRLSRTTKSAIGGSPSRVHSWARNICTNNPQLAYPPDFRSATLAAVKPAGSALKHRAEAAGAQHKPPRREKTALEGAKGVAKATRALRGTATPSLLHSR